MHTHARSLPGLLRLLRRLVSLLRWLVALLWRLLVPWLRWWLVALLWLWLVALLVSPVTWLRLLLKTHGGKSNVCTSLAAED